MGFLELLQPCMEPVSQDPETLRVEGISLEGIANVALILLVVLCDLPLSFLVVLDLQLTLARPVSPQVLVKLHHIVINQVFYLHF